MANISDAVGTISFDPAFYQQHKNIIDTYIQEMMKSDGLIAEYGITLTSQTEEEIEFTGSGRWSLSNILPSVLVPVSYYDHQQKVQSFEDFYDLMKKTKATIKLDYQDYEAGAEFLVHEIAILKVNPTPTEENISKCELFDAEVTTYPYEFNDYNKIALGFEEGYLLNDPRQKDKFIKQAFQPWYEEQDDKFKNEHPYSKLKNDILKYIKTDLDFENGICSWRYDEGFQNIVDDL